MNIAINLFEVTLPSIEFEVPCQPLPRVQEGETNSREKPRFNYRVVQRTEGHESRLLHVTDTPALELEIERVNGQDDPHFVKILIEEALANRLISKKFSVRRKHVESSAYMETKESIFEEIYTFYRGLSFRSFYISTQQMTRWGIVLNYLTSHRFKQSLASSDLSTFAIGKRVVRIERSNDDLSVHGHKQKSMGILKSVNGGKALIDIGENTDLEADVEDWTLMCRREVLVDYIHQKKGSKASTELTRKLQQASFSLTESGRMNTRLSRNQIEAIQLLIKDHELDRLTLPLPSRPMATLSSRPFSIGN